jgi:hypothetical protein
VCPEGTYRGLDDLGGCVKCDASLGKLCVPGSSYFAEFATDGAGVNTTNVVACIPFPYACLGTCPDEVAAFILAEQSLVGDDQGIDMTSCGPGVGKQSCTIGYEGPRCSACSPFDANIECSDTITNGYVSTQAPLLLACDF